MGLIETNHPRRSTCNCPFADDRRVVCKHMIALYFTAEPKAAKDFLRQVEEWEAEEQEREKQHYEDLRKYVNQEERKRCLIQAPRDGRSSRKYNTDKKIGDKSLRFFCYIYFRNCCMEVLVFEYL